MGQLLEALRDPQRRRAIEEGGGDYDYTDCFELLALLELIAKQHPVNCCWLIFFRSHFAVRLQNGSPLVKCNDDPSRGRASGCSTGPG